MNLESMVTYVLCWTARRANEITTEMPTDCLTDFHLQHDSDGVTVLIKSVNNNNNNNTWTIY